MSASSPGSINQFLNNPQLLAALYPNLNLSSFANLYQAESTALEAPLQNISTQVQTLTSTSSAWTQLQQAANQVLSDANNITQSGSWSAPSVNSSNTTALAAAVTSGQTPVAGSYAINVTGQAADNVYMGQAQSSQTAALGLSGSFSLNGQTINVSSSDSLQQIAQSINDANASVSATVLTQQNASGTSSYYLFITSNDYKAITVSDPNGLFASTGSAGLGEAQTQAATPWVYTVNGLQTQSTSNTDSTTIPGVTLTINATGSSTVSVTDSSQNAVSAIQQFVSDYNTLQSTVSQLTAKGQPLAGNVSAQSVMTQVNNALFASDPSQPAGFQSLASLGLTLSYDQSTNTSTLNFDQSTFQSQYSADPTAVQNLFTGSSNMVGQVASYLSGLAGTTGEISTIQQQINDQIQSMTQQEQNQQQLIQMQQQSLANLFNQEIQSLLAVQTQKSTVASLISRLSGGSGSSGSSGQGG